MEWSPTTVVKVPHRYTHAQIESQCEWGFDFDSDSIQLGFASRAVAVRIEEMDNDDVLTALPRYQVAHAARLGLTDPGKVFDFVVANQDQPDSFWFSGSVDVIMKEGAIPPHWRSHPRA